MRVDYDTLARSLVRYKRCAILSKEIAFWRQHSDRLAIELDKLVEAIAATVRFLYPFESVADSGAAPGANRLPATCESSYAYGLEE